jgi:OHCU decarboxylase
MKMIRPISSPVHTIEAHYDVVVVGSGYGGGISASRLARAGRLTAESTKEQASAGLDQLTDEERARFTELNDAYKARFGFPFIMAVKGRSKDEIMSAFERRIAHDRDQEFATALEEISRIALLRLGDMLPG